VRLPRPRRARLDGCAVGDDPEGEVDGDAAAAEVPRALVPRVGLQEVPEAAPTPIPLSPSLSLSRRRRRRARQRRRLNSQGGGSRARPPALVRDSQGGCYWAACTVAVGSPSRSLPLTSGPVLPIPVRDSSSSIPVERSRGRRPTRLRRHHGLGDRRRHARAERGRSASAAAGRGRRRRWAHRRPAISSCRSTDI